MSEIERCTPGRGHFMRFGDSQCECGEKRVYRNFGAQAEREIRETASQFDTWWRDHGALERLDQSHREAAQAAFDAGRASRHTGDCRRWRLVTGHRREYQDHHACTCGASSQREEPKP